MKKTLLVASLAVVSANALGMSIDRSRDAASSSMRSISQEASTSSNTRKRAFVENDSQQSKRRKIKELTDEEILRQTDPEKLEKIETFLGQRKKILNYVPELIKEALIAYCVHPEKSRRVITEEYGIVDGTLKKYIFYAGVSRRPRRTEEQINAAIAERNKTRSNKKAARNNNMHSSTLTRHAKQQGEERLRKKIDKAILDCYKGGGTFEDICKIVPSSSSDAHTKFAEVICSEISYINKVSLVTKNIDLLEHFRKGLLTDKGRINKYKNRSIRIGNICERNIGECEDYLIRNVAHQLGYDLSKLSVKWNIVVDKIGDFGVFERDQIIRDYNKGLLTYKGLAKKYKTSRSVVCSVLTWGKKNLKTVKPRVGSATAERMKATCSNQYNELNSKQKELFREILEENVADRRMPSDTMLEEIKDTDTHYHVINKFRKFLLILCNRENEIEMHHDSINKLKRELEEWKKLVKKDENH